MSLATPLLAPAPSGRVLRVPVPDGCRQDRVNCPFYLKIGACRNGERCNRVRTPQLTHLGDFHNHALTPVRGPRASLQVPKVKRYHHHHHQQQQHHHHPHPHPHHPHHPHHPSWQGSPKRWLSFSCSWLYLGPYKAQQWTHHPHSAHAAWRIAAVLTRSW